LWNNVSVTNPLVVKNHFFGSGNNQVVMNLVNKEGMTKIASVVLAVLGGVFAISLVASAVTTISTAITTAGNITTTAGNIEATAGTLTVGGTSVLTGDVTLSGGSGALVITTSNSATSTLQVGCIQTYATSTATAVRLVLSSAASSTATFGAGNAVGGVSWNYGTCPI
jgi:hypothetical protein